MGELEIIIGCVQVDRCLVSPTLVTQGSHYKMDCCRMPHTKRTTRGHPRNTSDGDADAQPSARRRGRSASSSMPALLQAASPSESSVEQYFDDEQLSNRLFMKSRIPQVWLRSILSSGYASWDIDRRRRISCCMRCMPWCVTSDREVGQLTHVLWFSRSLHHLQLPLILNRCLVVTWKFLPLPRLVS